ncbi:nuclear condensing complex subunit [Cubamyces menziesii]|nr:nuclear condensing complex subunit [Cubamyces menziesii]
MPTQDVLPEALLARCLDVLRVLLPSERDLIRVVAEVVHELRDPSDPKADAEAEAAMKGDMDDAETEMGSPRRPQRPQLPKLATEMNPEEKAQADAVDLRCLALCIGMLERVNSTFEENSTLEGILGELIVPAVKRREMALPEKGLTSLGLFCLIARRMALSSFQLFLSQVQSALEVLKIRVLQIIFDILTVHGGAFLRPGSANGDKIVDFCCSCSRRRSFSACRRSSLQSTAHIAPHSPPACGYSIGTCVMKVWRQVCALWMGGGDDDSGSEHGVEEQ